MKISPHKANIPVPPNAAPGFMPGVLHLERLGTDAGCIADFRVQ